MSDEDSKKISKRTFLQSHQELGDVISRVARASGVELRIPSDFDLEVSSAIEQFTAYNRTPIYSSDLPDKWWYKQLGPFIIQSRAAEEAFAMLPNGRGQYTAVSGSGISRRILDETDACTLSSRAWFFLPKIVHPSNTASAVVETADPEFERLAASRRSLYNLARKAWRPEIRSFILCILSSVVLSFSIPVLLSQLVDRALPVADIPFAVSCIALLVVCNTAQGLLVLARTTTLLKTQASVTQTTQGAVTWHLLGLAAQFYRGKSSGDLTHRSSLILTTSWELGSVCLNGLTAGLVAASNLLAALWLSPQLLAIVLPISFLEAGTYFILVRRVRTHAANLANLKSTILGLVVNWMRAINFIKSTAIESTLCADFDFRHSKVVDEEYRLQWLEDARKNLAVLLPAISLIVVLNASHGLQSSVTSTLTIGAIAGFIAAYRAFSYGLNGIAAGLAELLCAKAQLSLISPILSQSAGACTERTRLSKIKGNVEFIDVSFLYPQTKNGIQNATFQIKAGEFVGILGASGSGKSTLLRLLLGLELPQSGIIRFDGYDADSLDRYSIQQGIGSVLQSAKLLQGSVRENICFGRTVSIDQIRRSLENVEMLDTIDSLPMGIDTIVSQFGMNVSGGQSQRLLLARAIVCQPQLLILDESLSGLDIGQQSRILNRLKNLGVSTVLVSHREASFEYADRVLKVIDGRVEYSELIHRVILPVA